MADWGLRISDRINCRAFRRNAIYLIGVRGGMPTNYVEHEAASTRQILDAGDCLDGVNLSWFNRRFVGRAYVAFSGAVFALARSANFICGAQIDPIRYSKTGTSN